ncbi:MAG: small ribosomal subunit Rsm22 family protein [Chloroflexota bacterium]
MSTEREQPGIPRTLRLPEDLRAGVERALAQAPAARWTRAAQQLSERYRQPRAGGEQPLAHSHADVLGYLAISLPATYAQLRGAMAAAAARIPSWAPETLLDLGSGPGTALWAAVDQWPSLRRCEAWEREPAFIAVGRSLAAGSESGAVRGSEWRRVNLTAQLAGSRFKSAPRTRYDLVVLGHVLNELDPDVRPAVVAAAWELTAGLLLIVEPGTPAAFEVVRAARNLLLEAGAHTIAPCAHDAPCPLENDWCHFPQRIWRPEFQRRARGALSPWEESKYSYAAMARFAAARPIWGRVIREPMSNKAYAEAFISAREGIVRHRALKRHRDAYRRVQDLAWGEALEEPLEEPPS